MRWHLSDLFGRGWEVRTKLLASGVPAKDAAKNLGVSVPALCLLNQIIALC